MAINENQYNAYDERCQVRQNFTKHALIFT